MNDFILLKEKANYSTLTHDVFLSELMKRNLVLQPYLKETQSYSKNLVLLQKGWRSEILCIFIFKGIVPLVHLLRPNLYFILPYLLGMMLIPIFFYLIQFPRVPFSTYIILLYILLA